MECIYDVACNYFPNHHHLLPKKLRGTLLWQINVLCWWPSRDPKNMYWQKQNISSLLHGFSSQQSPKDRQLQRTVIEGSTEKVEKESEGK